jgi:hypothetical protein
MRHSLVNLAAGTLDRLADLVRKRLKRLQYRSRILDGFITATGLELDPPP